MYKLSLFFYFVQCLKRVLLKTNPSFRLDISSVFCFLFLAVEKKKELLTAFWEDSFNKFFASEVDSIIVAEEDIIRALLALNKRNEITVDNFNNISFLESKITEKINEEHKNLIEENVLKLGLHIYESNLKRLKTYVSFSSAWKNWTQRAFAYHKKFWQIMVSDFNIEEMY